MKVFCHNCGRRIEYAGEKPSFCSGCGSGLTVGSAPPSLESKPSDTPAEDEQEKKYDNIQELEVDIEHVESKKITVGDIGLQQSRLNSSREDFRTFKTQKLSKKIVLENFKKEAGTSRQDK